MLALPNLEVICEDKFSEEATAIALRSSLGDWKPEHKTLFIIDGEYPNLCVYTRAYLCNASSKAFG